jgi:hypothetical protein
MQAFFRVSSVSGTVLQQSSEVRIDDLGPRKVNDTRLRGLPLALLGCLSRRSQVDIVMMSSEYHLWK